MHSFVLFVLVVVEVVVVVSLNSFAGHSESCSTSQSVSLYCLFQCPHDFSCETVWFTPVKYSSLLQQTRYVTADLAFFLSAYTNVSRIYLSTSPLSNDKILSILNLPRSPWIQRFYWMSLPHVPCSYWSPRSDRGRRCACACVWKKSWRLLQIYKLTNILMLL